MRQGLHVQVVGVEVFGTFTARPSDLGGSDGRLNCANDAGGDPILKLEYIGQFSVEAVRPNMVARASLDQLPGNAKHISCLANAAFQYIAYAKLASDLADVDGPPLVDERRIARDDKKLPDTRKARDEVLDNAVGEVPLIGVARHVLEWQHSY